jgi:bacteriorhodopsin
MRRAMIRALRQIVYGNSFVGWVLGLPWLLLIHLLHECTINLMDA